MKTQTKYEEIILNEIRSMPLPALPQAVKLLKSLKDGVRNASRRRRLPDSEKTGFCGVWLDERSADEIIDDISSNRKGFGGRKVAL